MDKQKTMSASLRGLLKSGLVSQSTISKYLAADSEINLGEERTAALRTFEKLMVSGESVETDKLQRVELIFENGEVVVLDPAYLTNLVIQHRSQRHEDRFVLYGFSILFKTGTPVVAASHGYANDALGLRRLRYPRDITSIDLTYRNGRFVSYDVFWAPVSTDSESNFNQHFSIIDHAGFVYAAPQVKFPMLAAVRAGLSEDNLTEITTAFLTAYPGRDLEEARQLFRTQLTEMLAVGELSQQIDETSEFELMAKKVVPDQAGDASFWDPILVDLQSGDEYGGIEYESYRDLMTMNVVVSDVLDFWSGFEALLWEISWFGVKADERQQNIDHEAGELQDSIDELEAFESATAKMKRFIDWYVRQNITDPNLADFVDRYWPLTGGVVDPDWETPGFEGVVTNQDPELLAEFMANYGDLYNNFEARDD